MLRETLERRFWKKVRITEDEQECWLWIGSLNVLWGYGQFRIGDSVLRAHRVAYVLANGKDIPDGIYILHSCDVRACCNPKHLRAGTPSDNMKDEWERYRRPPIALYTRDLAGRWTKSTSALTSSTPETGRISFR